MALVYVLLTSSDQTTELQRQLLEVERLHFRTRVNRFRQAREPVDVTLTAEEKAARLAAIDADIAALEWAGGRAEAGHRQRRVALRELRQRGTR